MTLDSSFEALMARVKAGEADAEAQLFHRFVERLIYLARSRLPPRLRALEDPEDIVQSVFRSFFRRHAEGEWDLGGWDCLWALLTVLTVRKCGRRAVYHRAARRDVRRQVAPRRAGEGAAVDCEFLDREPTPDEAAQLAETLGDLLARLDPRDQQIVVLRLQGDDTAEIAEQAHCSRRTVERVLKEVRSRLERQQSEDVEGGEVSTPADGPRPPEQP